MHAGGDVPLPNARVPRDRRLCALPWAARDACETVGHTLSGAPKNARGDSMMARGVRKWLSASLLPIAAHAPESAAACKEALERAAPAQPLITKTGTHTHWRFLTCLLPLLERRQRCDPTWIQTCVLRESFCRVIVEGRNNVLLHSFCPARTPHCGAHCTYPTQGACAGV
jgi:hypothetical protein